MDEVTGGVCVLGILSKYDCNSLKCLTLDEGDSCVSMV